MPEKRISFLLNALVTKMNTQADFLLRATFSITYSQFLFLQVLAEAKQLDVTRLAEGLGVTKGAVSKRLEWFTERQLVLAEQDPLNGRRVLISLTAQGRELARTSGDYLESKFMVAIAETPNIDFPRLTVDLQSLLANLHDHKNDNPEGC